MKPPSREWREVVAPDEVERFQRYAEQLAAIQAARTRRYGKAGRALHRKGLLPLRARFEVLSEIPEHARHGLFAVPCMHDAWVRLSSGSFDLQRDHVPDIRGFAIKVHGVSGAGALGSPATSQDFLLINQESFGSARSDEFVGMLAAVSKGMGSLFRWLFATYGFLGGLRRARRLIAILNKKFSGFATETFWSAVPIACGPYAARVRLLPSSSEPAPDARRDWAGDLRRRLAAGPLTHDFQLQFFVDEETTPIEDASRSWPESEAPYVTVARLTLLPQPVDEESKLAEEIERASFDPWNALVEHRPLGDVMRARKVAYYASQQARAKG
jgi:hypothetical protein